MWDQDQSEHEVRCIDHIFESHCCVIWTIWQLNLEIAFANCGKRMTIILLWAGEKCALAPQSTMAPWHSAGTLLRLLAMAEKSDVHAYANFTDAAFADSANFCEFPCSLFFFANCKGPCPSWPPPFCQHCGLVCPSQPQFSHFTPSPWLCFPYFLSLCLNLFDLVLSEATSAEPPCLGYFGFFLESQKSASDSICMIRALGVSGILLEWALAINIDIRLL